MRNALGQCGQPRLTAPPEEAANFAGKFCPAAASIAGNSSMSGAQKTLSLLGFLQWHDAC